MEVLEGMDDVIELGMEAIHGPIANNYDKVTNKIKQTIPGLDQDKKKKRNYSKDRRRRRSSRRRPVDSDYDSDSDSSSDRRTRYSSRSPRPRYRRSERSLDNRYRDEVEEYDRRRGYKESHYLEYGRQTSYPNPNRYRYEHSQPPPLGDYSHFKPQFQPDPLPLGGYSVTARPIARRTSSLDRSHFAALEPTRSRHRSRQGTSSSFSSRSSSSYLSRSSSRSPSRSRSRSRCRTSKAKKPPTQAKELLTASLATVATIHAGAKIYNSLGATHRRHQAVREGKMTAEEAERKKNKMRFQEAASIGIAALGIKAVVDDWKNVKGMHEEVLKEKGRKREIKEWERGRGRSRVGRSRSLVGRSLSRVRSD